MKKLVTFISLCHVLFSVSAQTFIDSPIKTSNTAIYLGDQKWSWEVFVTTDDPKAINQVKCVTYYLHRTFKDPVQPICVKGSGPNYFPYSATGWGSFRMKVVIKFKNGKSKTLYHDLLFAEKLTLEPLPVTIAHRPGKPVKGGYPWTLYLKSSQDVLSKIRCVQYELDPSTLKEVCTSGNPSSAFAISGVSRANVEVKMKIYLTDGTVQQEKYQLKFPAAAH